MRAEIVSRTRISYRVAEEESTYNTYINPHTAKQKSKICPGVKHPPDLPLRGVWVTGGEGRNREERTYDVTDGGKDQKWIISNFQRLIFLQYVQKLR